jgi:engulfment/cell motility protein 1
MPELTIQRIGYIVEIMSNSFGTAEHHITLCLRDEADNLVTQATLPSKVASKETLK